MKNGQHQTMRMQQKLSPQQLLLMQLLQLPVTTLEQRMKEEVEKNPVLDITPESSAMMEALPNDNANEEMLDDAVADDDYSYRERLERDKNEGPREVVYAAEGSFGDHLMEQLSMRSLDERQLLIAQELIGSLDDAGYIGRDIVLIANDMAFTQGIEVSPDEVLEVLGVIQQLEPAGIAARSLQECLAIQLQRTEEQDEATQTALRIVQECFDLFVKHNYARILETLEIDEALMQQAIHCIQHLNPKPGEGESESDHAHYIVPDFIITRHDDQLTLALNDGQLPQLQFNAYYQEMLQELSAQAKPSASERETIDFLRDKTESADLLVATLQQRHTTMQRVMQVIFRRQHRYFLTGNPADLVPLLQKDVAEETGYDISTVSRVVNNKFVQTDFGTISLKSCFSQAIRNDEGDEMATEVVRQALQTAIDNEDKQHPLSDDELSQHLTAKGFPVARRTIAKYREMMGIPVARLRRSLKIVIFLVVTLLSGSVTAQEPQKESYFDSLIKAQIREGKAKERQAKQAEHAKANGKNGKSATSLHGQEAIEEHEAEAEPNHIDTMLASGDELINVMYNATLPPPSSLWYGKNLSGAHVRLVNFSMDSLPDEVSIQLLKDNEKFCFPVKNIITSPYGWRWERPHRGVDIRLKTGEPVHAAFNGVVRIARSMGGYGNLIVIRHYNGLETVYGHLSKINVKPMQIVAAGQVIGLGGSTGHSTGPHLHFEVRFQYEPFDPEWILDFSNYSLRTRRLYLDKTYFGIRKPSKHDVQVYKADKSIVPEEAAKPKQPSKPIYATLKKGESMEDFAKRNYTTVEKLKQLNENYKKLKTGDRVRVR
ncbi:MAG: RNA polymerase factor sigma-54 [Bacteroidales bacterium]|nr:RNA polymerase factor sigma-54 [Bacteroidales bacterium]